MAQMLIVRRGQADRFRSHAGQPPSLCFYCEHKKRAPTGALKRSSRCTFVAHEEAEGGRGARI